MCIYVKNPTKRVYEPPYDSSSFARRWNLIHFNTYQFAIMKKQNIIPMIFFSAALVFLIASCSKTGPTGPAGSTGATGAAGPAGLTGPQGPQGNANVKTDTFSLTSSQWLWNSQYEVQTNPSSYTYYFTRYHNVTNAAITQGILDSGMVLVYFTPNTTGNTSQWAPLPYEFSDGSGNFNYEIVFETSVGGLRLHYFFVQTVAAATIPTLSTYAIATYKFKIVVVSGVLSSSMKSAHVDVNDYNAVSRFTGITP